MKVFIVGYMLSGKSTIGKRLAKLMNYTFIDTDKEIENQYKLSVSDIFKKYGEETFRLLERKYLLTLQEKDNIVVSTGGGLVCFNDNMQWVKANGVSIYLKLSPAAIVSRHKISKRIRPLLRDKTDEEALEYITKTLQEREIFYNQADFSFDALNLKAEEIIKIIL
jgi:shikimate kinase